MNQVSGTNEYLWDVLFTDLRNGTVVGGNGTILRSTDAGESWTAQLSGTTRHLRSVFFIDSMNGSIVGDHGTILRTTDAGATWTARQSGVISPLLDLVFTDERTAFAVGGSGAILRTTDGGSTWVLLSGITRVGLTGVAFTDKYNGTIVGGYGTILRTTTGGVTWVEEEESAPAFFHLGQNYPNPVTASTTIPFTITKPEHVMLSVYNLLGRRVAVLVDELRPAGPHAVPYDTEGLAPGMYIYVLRTGSSLETRKLLQTNAPAPY